MPKRAVVTNFPKACKSASFEQRKLLGKTTFLAHCYMAIGAPVLLIPRLRRRCTLVSHPMIAAKQWKTKCISFANWPPRGQFSIFREYLDEETGTSASRPSFLALLRDARLRRFRVLLITDLDRLTREGAAAGFGTPSRTGPLRCPRRKSWTDSWLDDDPDIDEDQ